jgi:hypothetical protein
MPIEIKELHIKAVVSEKDKLPGKTTMSSEDISRMKKEITKEVTAKVLRAIQQKNER